LPLRPYIDADCIEIGLSFIFSGTGFHGGAARTIPEASANFATLPALMTPRLDRGPYG
jgi:hypothetical protein